MVAVNNIDFTKFIPTDDGSSYGGSFNAQSFTNSIYTIADPNAGTEEKVEAGVKFSIDFLLSLLGKKEEATAKEQVDDNKSAATDLVDNLDGVVNNTTSQMEEIIAEIEATIERIQTNINQIEESNEEKESYQEEIEKLTLDLTTAVEIINNPEASAEEKRDALEKIDGVQAGLADLEEKVTEINENVVALTESTDELGAASEGLNSDSEDVINDGNQQLQNGQRQVEQQEVTNATTQATGVTNIATSEAAQAAGETAQASSSASSAVPIIGGLLGSGGQALAQQLFSVAGDQGGAGEYRIGSYAPIANLLTYSKDLINTNLPVFSNFPNSIGGLMRNSTEFSSNFYSITGALGEWTDLAMTTIPEVNETLDEVQDSSNDSENPDKKLNIDTEALEVLLA